MEDLLGCPGETETEQERARVGQAEALGQEGALGAEQGWAG